MNPPADLWITDPTGHDELHLCAWPEGPTRHVLIEDGRACEQILTRQDVERMAVWLTAAAEWMNTP